MSISSISGEFNYTFTVDGEDRKKVRSTVRVKDADGNFHSNFLCKDCSEATYI